MRLNTPSDPIVIIRSKHDPPRRNSSREHLELELGESGFEPERESGQVTDGSDAHNLWFGVDFIIRSDLRTLEGVGKRSNPADSRRLSYERTAR